MSVFSLLSARARCTGAGQNLRDPSCQVPKVKRTVRVTERSQTVLIVTSPSSKTADDQKRAVKLNRLHSSWKDKDGGQKWKLTEEKEGVDH
ncbi:unnamed protein product [Leuciscus chuanchicus]